MAFQPIFHGVALSNVNRGLALIRHLPTEDINTKSVEFLFHVSFAEFFSRAENDRTIPIKITAYGPHTVGVNFNTSSRCLFEFFVHNLPVFCCGTELLE